MTDILNERALTTKLQERAAGLGLPLREDAVHHLSGQAENVRAKWWLGGRKVAYRMACRMTEADHTLHFREAVVERSWGIPPPTLTIETTRVSGWKRSGGRRDISLGGGGSLDYARMRQAVEQETAAAGWTFHLEGGRLP